MTILCFEGPSAVGKTTTARAFAQATGARVVPDVAALFDRPPVESPDWYFERQVERWRLAAESEQNGVVVLDGDPFQPLWYNWAFGFQNWQSLEFLERFYKPRVARGDIDFPDLYVLFGASVEALRERRQNDEGRRRRNFEEHLRFIEPQRRYFEALDRLAPGSVLPVSAHSVTENVATIVATLDRKPARPASVQLLDDLIGWLRAEVA